jgi:SWI/SNF-related matrix-associated actin-dependent regulator of chromatin subfamily B protein 1
MPARDIHQLTPSTALAHDIHEQILVHKRSLFLVGHTPGSGLIQDDDVRSAFLPSLSDSTVVRREDVAMNGFTPIFMTHAPEDLAAIESTRDKESKRKKRAGRARRGVVLPDREPLKTHRSLVNPIGPNGLAAPVLEGDRATAAASAPLGSSRRAAAIAAQANINLLAQDLPLPPPPSPPPAQPPTSRRGKWNRNRGESREQSVLFGDNPPGSAIGTPSMSSVLGAKRGLREDSVAESVSSPVPPHKRRSTTRVIESPTPRETGEAPGSNAMELDIPSTVKEEDDVKPRMKITLSQANVSKPTPSNIPQHPSPLPPHQSYVPPAVPQNILNPHGAQSATLKPPPPSDSSDSDSSDSDDDDFVPASQVRQPTTASTAAAPTPNRTVSASGAMVSPVTPANPPSALAPGSAGTEMRATGSSGASTTATTPSPPEWTKTAHAELSGKYPLDRFAVVPKKVEGAPMEWRIKCLDW